MKNNMVLRAVPMLLLLLFVSIAIVGPVSAAEEESAAVCYCEQDSDRSGVVSAYARIEWNFAETEILHLGRADATCTCEYISVSTELTVEETGDLVSDAFHSKHDSYFDKASDYFRAPKDGTKYRNTVIATSSDPYGHSRASKIFVAK